MSEALERLAGLLEGLPKAGGGHLSFHDRCAAFALVNRGFPQSLVARTFGVSAAAICTLKNCQTGKRYHDVAHEFNLMGRDAFVEKYCTSDILDRLARLRANVINPGENLIRGSAANPTADSAAGPWFLPETKDQPSETFEVVWIDHEGWTWSHQGFPHRTDRFRTSIKAREAGYQALGPDCERERP